MASILDVAEYILEKKGYVSTMKLQKLAFYSNALSLVETHRPLFPETFQAWVNGPVSLELYRRHRGRLIIGSGSIAPNPKIVQPLSAHERSFVDRTLHVLGDYEGDQLSGLSHGEAPWSDARQGCGDSDRCSVVISNEAIEGFYASRRCDNPLFLGGRTEFKGDRATLRQAFDHLAR